MKEAVLKALSTMDAAVDTQWTGDGSPKVDFVSEVSGITNLSRKDITEAAPLFSKSNMILDLEKDDPFEEVEEIADSTLSELDEWQERQARNIENRSHPDVLDAVEEIREIEASLAEGKKALEKANENYRKMVEKYAPTQNSPKDNQLGIMNHIQSQVKQRQQRVASGADIMKMVKAQAKAPIDRVAARPSGYGKTRQVRGAQVE